MRINIEFDNGEIREFYDVPKEIGKAIDTLLCSNDNIFNALLISRKGICPYCGSEIAEIVEEEK